MFMVTFSHGYSNREKLEVYRKVGHQAFFHHTQVLGQRKVFIGSDEKYEYTGELDKDGNACGFGIAVGEIDKDARYESTWFQNKRHGIGERDNSFIFKLSLCRRIVHQQS